jgi:hypothetical protein
MEVEIDSLSLIGDIDKLDASDWTVRRRKANIAIYIWILRWERIATHMDD